MYKCTEQLGRFFRTTGEVGAIAAETASGNAVVEALRVKYKIKRNFIKLAEQKRKSLYPRMVKESELYEI
jgi:hypothetical protein